MYMPMIAETFRTARRRARSRMASFGTETEGSVTIFSLFVFLMMLIFAGMAVDLMRYETKRTALQNTIDSAVLAAANLNRQFDSTVTAETLVKNFFEKSGYDPESVVVKSEDDRIGDDPNGEGGTLIGRWVTADYDLDVNTFFMKLIGIEELRGVSAGKAEENIQGVEISLVVDISGSMSGTKIASLKTSAVNFLNIVMPDDDEVVDGGAKTSVSLIPYNWHVNVPTHLLDELNTQAPMVVQTDTPFRANPAEFPGALETYNREASNSRCVRFQHDQMVTTDIDTNYLDIRRMDENTHLERYAYYDYANKSAGPGDSRDRPADSSNRFCNMAQSPIVVHETRKSVLTTAINALTAGGNTSVDQGMKWGLALLDPNMDTVINALVDDDVLTEDVRNRPGSYDGTETMKVIVLMTDGANTTVYDLKEEFKRGPSPVWFSSSEADGMAFTSNDDADADYWDGFWVEAGATRNYGSANYHWYLPHSLTTRDDGEYRHRNDLPSDAVQLSWQQLFDRFSQNVVADLFRDRSDLDDNGLDGMRNQIRNALEVAGESTYLDQRLNGTTDGSGVDTSFGVCDAATYDNDIIVFTIAFDVAEGSNPEQQMQNCATSGGYSYSAADEDELDEAYQAIAGEITRLRLTQ